MPLYIKLSTEIKDDDKLNKAGPAAGWLWLRGLAWSKERLTDGFVAEGALRILCCGLGNPAKLSERLVEVGLWTQVHGGYTVGPERWARHQTTKEQVEAKRDKWKTKKRVQRGQNDVSPGDNSNVPSSEPEIRARDQRTEPEGGKPPDAPPRSALSRDADRPDMGANVREAMRAIERWSLRDRNGAGLDAVHGEFHAAEDRCTNGWQGDTPIVHAGEPVNPLVLVPLAVERLMGKPNGPKFKSAKFACGCIDSELRDMRARGTQPTNAKPARDYSALKAALEQEPAA